MMGRLDDKEGGCLPEQMFACLDAALELLRASSC